MQDFPWHRALSLRERANSGASIAAYDLALGQHRYRRWKTLGAFSLGSFGTDDVVLSPFGVSADGLTRLLGETDDSLKQRFPDEPGWARTARRWWTEGSAELRSQPEFPNIQYANCFVPFVIAAQQELERLLSTAVAPLGALGPELIRTLVDNPPVSELYRMCTPTAVLRLHLEREAGKLAGDTSQARHTSFIALLAEPGYALGLLSTYPVLLRIGVERLCAWRDRSLEFAGRLAADLDEISRNFWLGALPSSVELRFDAGDSHDGGRTVAIVATDKGKVVYKPRACGLESAYERIIELYNLIPGVPRLRAPRVLARENYLWMEFVPESIPQDVESQELCLMRLGSLNLLLHLLAATDMHYENVLLEGADPVPVDLEALFHGHREFATPPTGLVNNVAAEFIERSCLSVGILPNRVAGKDETGAVHASDLSLFGNGPWDASIVALPELVNDGSDEARIEFKRSTVPPDFVIPAGFSMRGPKLPPTLCRSLRAGILLPASCGRKDPGRHSSKVCPSPMPLRKRVAV